MKNNIRKVVIINTVPINGGDEALLYGTIKGLNEHFNNPKITVLCNNPDLTKKYIKNINIDWDWEYVFRKSIKNEDSLTFKIKSKIRSYLNKSYKVSYYSKISRLFASLEERRVFRIFKNTDIVLLGAGGYIHDFYGFDERLKTVNFLNYHLQKPYVFFFQSIGPFWKEEKYPKLIEVFKNAHAIILRENISFDHLKKINYSGDNIQVSSDVAFNLVSTYAIQPDVSKTMNKVVVNFREWKYESDSSFNFEKAKAMCEYLISKGCSITFLSTCQGIDGYVDDSDFAKRIVESMDAKLSKSCTIIDDKIPFKEFIHMLSNYDAYVGMRLHGAILSLIAGIPALNIAYEDKTFGIFNALDISDYAFSYKEDFTVWTQKIDNFINTYDIYLNNVEHIRNKAYDAVEENFKRLKS